MKFIQCFLLVFVFFARATIYSNLKNGVLSFLRRPITTETNGSRHTALQLDAKNKYVQNVENANNNIQIRYKPKETANVQKIFKGKIRNRKTINDVINSRRRREKNKHDDSSEPSDSFSSSMELKNWKEEWRDIWQEKKYEALNSTIPPGDSVNMIAARPWGVPCGDPNQHDVPWGSCMLPAECDAEFRIYRGDHFCGRTRFVCCAIMSNIYDNIHGFDASFDSEVGTDSDELREKGRGSAEKKRKRHEREKKRHRYERRRRKRRIHRLTKKIMREIKSRLHKMYQNKSNIMKKKTSQLKKFIKVLKKDYKKNRLSVHDIHSLELKKADVTLTDKLTQLKHVNKQFITNSTFRDLIVNGTVNKLRARTLFDAYPELVSYALEVRRSGKGVGSEFSKKSTELNHDLEYDSIFDEN